jgi:branched-chain amino acid transport system permease protein
MPNLPNAATVSPIAALLSARTGAFAASAALAGLAAFVVAPTQGVSYDGGDLIAIKSFMAVAIGGLGSYRGGVVGAFGVALTEAYLARHWNPAAQQIVILIAFLLVLYFRAVGTSSWVHALARRGRALRGRAVEASA